ncbi:hypothetical protein WMY93_009313 [Mugilogobius chulae]|uniref:Rhodanese domain-containing protein n=1 Tax=Mugilogobius chulae TaxID=88201 RepID=A0AAW0PBE6_9GOBI
MENTVTKEISYNELKALVGKSPNLVLIDVRGKDEYKNGHISGSVNIPVNTVEKALAMSPEEFKAAYGVTKPEKDAPELVFHCQLGRRGAVATEKAQAMGYVNACNYAGAYKECFVQANNILTTIAIFQTLRLLLLMTKDQKQAPENKGGLLVLIWTELHSDAQSLNCTVAAAGSWCAAIQMEELHPVFADVMERLCPCPGPCPEPDIEDLCAFTDLHGSLNVFLSFRMKNVHICRPLWQHQVESFLHTLSMTNAEINIHLKIRSDQKLYQREFRVKDYLRVQLSDQTPVYLDVSVKTSTMALLESFKSGHCFHGGHPDIGENLLLSIPPKIVEQGLFGTVTIQLVTLLRPTLPRYPNVATNLTQIKISFTSRYFFSQSEFQKISIPSCSLTLLFQVLVYSHSNVPVTSPPAFMQNFPSDVNCYELGLQNNHLSFQEVLPSGGTVYKVQQVNLENDVKSSLRSIDQSLLLFLFLQHTDPFTMEISDIMATDMLLEHHLEDILVYNKQILTNAMANVLKKTMTAQNNRKKDQRKLNSACEVIHSSALCIISCSSNIDFRNACLNTLKVHNTQEMSVAILESLRRVTLLKLAPNRKSCSDQAGQQRVKNKHRIEM